MKSIYLRNFVAIAALVAICFLLVALSFVGVGRQYVISENSKNMDRSAEEIAHIAGAVSREDSLDSWALRMNVCSVAAAAGNQIFVTDEEGVVRCCSDKDPKCEHIGLQISGEILAQAESGFLDRRSDLGGVFPMRRYVAAETIRNPEGALIGYVFVNNMADNMLGAWSTFLSVAVLISVVVFCITLALTMV